MQNLAASETAARSAPSLLLRQETGTAAPEERLQGERLAVTPEERRKMQQRIRRIRRRSLLTPDALAQLGQSRLPTETLHALLTMLEGPFEEHWEERATAAWALGLAHLTPRQQQTVSRVLCHVLRRKMLARSVHNERWLDAPIVMVAIPWLLCWLFALTWRSSEGQGSPVLFQAGALFGSMYIGYRLNQSLKTAATVRANRLRATAATALGRIACVDSIATLARTALDGSRMVRRAAEPALMACLAQLTSAHYGDMEADVVPNLCRLLERAREQLHRNSASATELALCILDALGKIGDGRAVPAARNLINTGWTAPVNQAAKELLPLLLTRQQQETNQRILLRGATMPTDPPLTLLRPIENPADDPQPQTLLRPPNGG